jgi:prepilin-type N-terminal cleavage/methylation domain-containing protein
MDNRSIRGLTLIEVLVVAGIISLLSTLLISNFSQSRIGLNRAAAQIANGLRTAQSRALAGVLRADAYPCGYGITMTVDGYRIYAGSIASGVDCATLNRNYDLGDSIVENVVFPNQTIEVILPVPDIFFEPPNPKTYINNVNTAGVSTTITIRIKGSSNPSDTRTIYVTTSGNIEVQY